MAGRADVVGGIDWFGESGQRPAVTNPFAFTAEHVPKVPGC